MFLLSFQGTKFLQCEFSVILLTFPERELECVQLAMPSCDLRISQDHILYLLQTKTNKNGGNQEVEIAHCHKGQYFGELALVTNKPRAASAYAVGDVKCLGKKMSL